MARRSTQAPAGAELAEHYGELLEEQAASGLSMVEFAEEAGVSAATLYSWRRKLSSKEGNPGRSQLLQVAVTDTLESARPRPGIVTLRVGEEYEVELGEDFDADALRRLLTVLAGC